MDIFWIVLAFCIGGILGMVGAGLAHRKEDWELPPDNEPDELTQSDYADIPNFLKRQAD